jgi:alkanesulfonate monooxygenase SsuD/methylene tetrahydromethanopterin reductase-like flavin-dependent oxidoreductase (luciferase family)
VEALAAAVRYPLPAAQPVHGSLPLLIGGRGERRTLRIVAEHADEWNVTRVTADDYVQKCRVLDRHCRAAGRDPATIRRSLMVPVIAGRSRAELGARHTRARALFPRVPEDEAAWRAAGFLYGAPEEIARDLRR